MTESTGSPPVLSADAIEQNILRSTWGSLRFFANRELGTANLTVGRTVIQPGERNPRHSHPNCAEVLYLLSGTLDHYIGNEKYPMSAGDRIVIPAGVPHFAVNTGAEDADMIVCFDSGDREFKLE
jgi:quercetin dioxygenase-like cupin family protein